MKKRFHFLWFGLLLISSLAGAGMNKGDPRDSAPIVTADIQHPPTLPDSSDQYYTMKYKATNPDAIEDLARLVRSFTPATSRIIPSANLLSVTEPAANLKDVYILVKENDVKATPEMKRKWQVLERLSDHRYVSDAQGKTSSKSK